jgi:hypothetical protein
MSPLFSLSCTSRIAVDSPLNLDNRDFACVLLSNFHRASPPAVSLLFYRVVSPLSLIAMNERSSRSRRP